MENNTNQTSNDNQKIDEINAQADSIADFLLRSKAVAESIIEKRNLQKDLKKKVQEQKKLAPMAERASGGFTGPLLLVLGLIILALSIGYMMVTYFLYHNTTIFLYLLFLIPLIFSFYLVIEGLKLRKRANIYSEFKGILLEHPYISIEDLAQDSDLSKKKTLSYVHLFLDENLYPKGKLVKNNQYLVLSPRALSLLNESLEVKKKQQRETEKVETLKTDYPKLYSVVDEISETQTFLGDVLLKDKNIGSLKKELQQTDYLLTKIKDYILNHPEEIPDVRSYLNYFLPTVQKLLKTYESLGQETLVTKNISESKEEIESVLYTINEALENMYNDFYSGTAIDVYSDVSVLKTVLHQEGLVDSDFNQE